MQSTKQKFGCLFTKLLNVFGIPLWILPRIVLTGYIENKNPFPFLRTGFYIPIYIKKPI